MAPHLDWTWLGRRPYAPVHARQLRIRRGILDGTRRPTLLLVEHDPVVTLGRRGGDADLALPRDVLSERGVDVVSVQRGGLATYHGPGQLVGYPVIPLESFGLKVPTFVALIEQVILDYLAGLGLKGRRRDAYPGVWVGRSKVAAIGLHIHRGVSIHGFALNLTVRPQDFSCIVPCGIAPRDGTVSSVAAIAGAADEPAAAAPVIARMFSSALVE